MDDFKFLVSFTTEVSASLQYLVLPQQSSAKNEEQYLHGAVFHGVDIDSFSMVDEY